MDLEARAKAMAGNYLHMKDMLWSAEPRDGQNWALVATKHRDSTNIDKSNATVIESELCEQFPDDAHIERFSDWLVGWSENLVLRVYDAQGNITPAFAAFAKLAERMERYPLLDESLYSEMEEEDITSILKMALEQSSEIEIKDNLPGGWMQDLRRQLDDYDSDIRGDGWWPRPEHLQAALQELGYLRVASADEIEV